MAKPNLFIGSSSEAKDAVEEIRAVLADVASTTAWFDDWFQPMHGTLEKLIEAVETFDFAIFVATPDDQTKMRDHDYQTARDNVIFELGLFLRGLGAGRTFLLASRGDLHLPSDFDGISIPRFDAGSKGLSLRAEIAAALVPIKNSIKTQGRKFTEPVEVNVGGCPVRIGIGNITQYDRPASTVLVPTDVYFDTTFDEDVVSRRSALGALLEKREKEGRLDALDATIDSVLAGKRNIDSRAKVIANKPGRGKAFSIGEVLEIRTAEGDLLLAAVCDLERVDNSYKASPPAGGYQAAFRLMWKGVCNRRAMGELATPLLGTGYGGMNKMEGLTRLLVTFGDVLRDQRRLPCSLLKVVVMENDWGDGAWVRTIVDVLPTISRVATPDL